MSQSADGLGRLRGVAHRLLWGAVACLVLPALAWLGTALYGALTPTAGGRPVELLTAILVLYVAPVGVVLLVLGLVAGAWAWWLSRERAREKSA